MCCFLNYFGVGYIFFDDNKEDDKDMEVVDMFQKYIEEYEEKFVDTTCKSPFAGDLI